MAEKVEMRPAYEWTCPECGRDSFVRCVIAELTNDEREEYGIDPNVEMQSYPESVTCPHCNSEFECEALGGHPEEE